MQGRFLRCTARFIDFEGALRSGKSKALVWFFINLCLKYPGIKVLLARFTDDALNIQLKPLFFQECPSGMIKQWHGDMEYVEFENGSWCYLRSLKPSDDRMRFAKTAGLTLAAIGVDQPEELPEDIGKNLIGRISQPGYPQHLVFTPNPPNNDHWIAQMFPEDPNKIRPDHEYLWTSVYDNVEHIGTAYIHSLEDQWPPGHVLHRRNILGKRGLSVQGEPVYATRDQSGRSRGLFVRAIHAIPNLAILPSVPVWESWDFGHKHPCVTWGQFPNWGLMLIHAELMGDRVYLEDFVPQVLTLRERLFGPDVDLWCCCDPAGADQQSSGRRGTAIEALNEKGIYPAYVPDSNHPRKRTRSIQRIASYLQRLTANGPAFQINDRLAPLTADALEGGYVYPEKEKRLMQAPNLRMPKKDDYYEHPMNTVEYAVLNFGIDIDLADLGTGIVQATADPDQLRERQIRSPSRRERIRLMRQAGLDTDDEDRETLNRNRTRRSRAGY